MEVLRSNVMTMAMLPVVVENGGLLQAYPLRVDGVVTDKYGLVGTFEDGTSYILADKHGDVRSSAPKNLWSIVRRDTNQKFLRVWHKSGGRYLETAAPHDFMAAMQKRRKT